MTKNLKWLLAALAVGVAAYWYGSPYLALHTLRKAAQAQDLETINDHVDYPQVRESVKGQMAAMLAEEMSHAQAQAPDDPFTRAGAALGGALGMAFLDKLVDALVRPEAIASLVQKGKARQPAASRPQPQSPPASSPAGSAETSIQWRTKRHSLDKLLVSARDEADPGAGWTTLVLQRSGFATWKITEVRMPNLRKAAPADSE